MDFETIFYFFQVMIEDVELVRSEFVSSGKTFKKQRIQKAISSEIVHCGDDFEMHNELYTTTTVWFRPAVDPRRFDIKMPEKVQYGGVAFSMFPCFEVGVSHIYVNPKSHVHIGTGVILNTGLQVTQNPTQGFEHAPNWFGQIVSTKEMEKVGVFTGSSIIDPHDEDEIGISLFNMGDFAYKVQQGQPIGQIVFAGCHSPTLSINSHNLVHQFDREYISKNIYMKCLNTRCLVFCELPKHLAFCFFEMF
jgi:hypothetical protein